MNSKFLLFIILFSSVCFGQADELESVDYAGHIIAVPNIVAAIAYLL